MDGRKNNGGNKNAGRKRKADEEHSRAIICKALNIIYKKDDNEEAQIEFLKEFAETQRGQQFIAEHIFGKPTDYKNLTLEPSLISIDMTKWK